MAAKLLLWTTRVLTLLMVVVSVLPMIPSGQWWARLWEFPRLQLAWALVVPLVLLAVHAWWNRPRPEHAAWVAVILATGAWQLSHILPFTPAWSTEVPAAEIQPGGARTTLKVLSANVTYTNDRYPEVLAMVRREDPDLLLLIEVDRAWAEGLAPLDQHYAHRVGEVRSEGLGIVLWSRFPLLEQEVKHLVSERRPSIFATVDVPGIGPVRYVGTHPVPPGLRDRIAHNDETTERRDSRVRDAELMLVARHIRRDSDNRWIVTGDFNDVAWSDSTRLFADLSDLKDPRRGRRLLSTYHAKRPLWRYPIDHLFVSDGFHLVDLSRVRVLGSDHFAVTATLAVARKDHAKPKASAEEQQQAREMVEEGAEDAAEHGVSSTQAGQGGPGSKGSPP
ncbi:endonuclease/exonuclease/phosphatase family protein [Halomonas cerina]|uniref:Endonuclease/exonuclease/phosphatase (EEP) superfamily protein YafD n=1 Tax=Halomonas cerina TaxID=447424 RepID=A0A839V952_9GAMM|nr:endonuclease/exonuclease/phosphatase family protein [Halomonas cerina]MBB3191972.1 endonuclease/exonuclease/phosphatase (EEP) superfamily protein YafD [Halomonas cerina]